LNRIEFTTKESSALGGVQLALEAIVEDISVKKKLFTELSEKLPADAILASNTSSLSITELARGIEAPDRVVGMHFFNPAEKMPLVEIIRGEQTSDKSVVIVAALASKLGKFPIVVSDVPGFLINRILSPYLNEALQMLLEGYRVEDIDRAATAFGMPVGPLRLLDEIGLDVAAHVAQVLEKGYGARMKAPLVVSKLLEIGRKGKKSGGGFYDWHKSKHSKSQVAVYSEIYTILNVHTALRSIQDLTPLTERLVFSLLNEAVRCLDESVSGTPGPEAASQIDLGMVMGIGFPPFRGGILHFADQLGCKKILETMQQLNKSHGDRFAPAAGITSRAKRNKKFSDKVL
jgi:3-hydroxyacyl-CoA dehydrogenase/enoyl-CoA hydratase/3-hydroxybutyryl-CoA epimerase